MNTHSSFWKSVSSTVDTRRALGAPHGETRLNRGAKPEEQRGVSSDALR